MKRLLCVSIIIIMFLFQPLPSLAKEAGRSDRTGSETNARFIQADNSIIKIDFNRKLLESSDGIFYEIQETGRDGKVRRRAANYADSKSVKQKSKTDNTKDTSDDYDFKINISTKTCPLK